MNQQTKPGDRVATVGRDGARCARVAKGEFSVPCWTGKIYEAVHRADGILTWRFRAKFGGSRSGRKPSAQFCRDLQTDLPLPWVAQVRHGDICP